MPSLHGAWAMLIWFNARPLDAMRRRLLRTFAAANLFATMGLRDTHWLTDLVVPLPMTIGIQAICNTALALTSRARWTVLLASSALVSTWFVALWWALPLFTGL